MNRNRIFEAMAVAAVALLGITIAAAQSAPSGRAYLGVYLSDLSDGTRKALGLEEDQGVLVERVSDDSPAQKAGMQNGDVILEIGGKPVDSSSELHRRLNRVDPDDEVTVAVWRGGKRVDLTVTLGRKRGLLYSYTTDSGTVVPMPDVAEAPDAPLVFSGGDTGGFSSVFFSGSRPRLGVRTQELNGQLAAYFEVTNGILVTWVSRNSVAAKAGIAAGDVLVALEGETIHRERDLLLILEDLRGEESADLELVRRGDRKALTVTFED